MTYFHPQTEKPDFRKFVITKKKIYLLKKERGIYIYIYAAKTKLNAKNKNDKINELYFFAL